MTAAVTSSGTWRCDGNPRSAGIGERLDDAFLEGEAGEVGASRAAGLVTVGSTVVIKGTVTPLDVTPADNVASIASKVQRDR